MSGKLAEQDKELDQQRYQQLLREANSIHGVSLWQDGWRRLKANPSAMISLYFLSGVVVLALLTPVMPLQSPIQQDVANRKFQTPNFDRIPLGLQKHQDAIQRLEDQLKAADEQQGELLREQIDGVRENHPLKSMWNQPGLISRALLRLRVAIFADWCIPSLCGTDALGRDLLSRIMWGARVSLAVGIVAGCVSLLIGVTYGATAAYLGGEIDNIMMRIVDVMYSVPFIFVVIYLITVLSEEKRKAALASYGIDQITIFYFVIGLIYWLTMARVVRGQVISLKNEQFIEAARTIGASTTRIILRHLIPNVMGVVIVYLTLAIPSIMLFEAFLSFLGLGVNAPDVSWGLLVNEGLQVVTPVRSYWWLVLFPGLILSLTLLSLNFLGDGLRDALDPRLKNR